MAFPEIIAHRGSSLMAPENTRASVELAWREGADAVEGDFRVTRDGHVVAMHDRSLRRTTGVARMICDCTMRELRQLDAGMWKHANYRGERIPTLAELLATIPPGKRFFVEVKCGAEAIKPLRSALVEAGVRSEQAVFIALNLDVIAAIKRGFPEYQAFWVVDLKRHKHGGLGPAVDGMLREAETHGLDGLDLSANDPLDRDMIARIHAAGLRTCVWTVDDPHQAIRLVEMGVQAITTNCPGRLRGQLQHTS